MKNFEIGIRKYVEKDVPEYWVAINAKPAKVGSEAESARIYRSEKPEKKWSRLPLHFTKNIYWKLFVLTTILINVFIAINFFPHGDRIYTSIVIIVHLTCLVYWIDVLGSLASTIAMRKKIYNTSFFYAYYTVDFITLLPLSAFYLIIEPHPDVIIFWFLRLNTLIRFYRVPLFLSGLQTAEKNHWKIQVASYIFYFIIMNDFYINTFLYESESSDIHIYDWEATIFHKMITALYFVLITTLNVGYGDIYPIEILEIVMTTQAMIVGFAIITGLVTAAFATEIANKEKRREDCRNEFQAIMSALKKHKIDKKVIEKTSENFMALWKYKRGYSSAPPVHLLPLSLSKEIFYDINLGLLSRSIIFSTQPRSFLRSLSLYIINLTFLPGDIISTATGLADGIIMISSGIVEILSEENDETPILSFTTGTVLGEVALFTSIPFRCVIKASTLVTMQKLDKISFMRLVAKYPYVYRSMRAQIFERLDFVKTLDLKEHEITLEEEFNENSRKKSAKRLLKELRQARLINRKLGSTSQGLRERILNLYVIAENIPKVKTLPITLIKSKPWILRPHTDFTLLWNIIMVCLTITLTYMYPYYTAFVRVLGNESYMILKVIHYIFIADIFVKSITAIERKDHFTYITSMREILRNNLRKPGFYFDVLAAFDLTVYSDLLNLSNRDYAYLLLSLNKLLKFHIIPGFFGRLENNLAINLFFIRGCKYFIYFTTIVIWVAAAMFLEACPDTCIEDRWYEDTEIKESLNPTPCSAWPAILSLYWATVSSGGVGYGDIRAASIMDCVIVIICVSLAIAYLTYFTAQSSSTAKHTNRTKTIYQEELYAVVRFLQDHDINPELQDKVRNYFRVQWDYDKGFEMRQNIAQEGNFFPQNEIMLPHIIRKLLTVPLFQDTSSAFLRALAKFSRMRLLPPNEVIIDTGSFIKEMYIIENGYCEITLEEDERYVASPVKPIGYLEMILGLPINVNMKTITHVRIICLDFQAYLRAVTMYPSVKSEIDAKVKFFRRAGRLKETLKKTLLMETVPYTKPRSQKYLSRAFINVYQYHKKMGTSYWAPFQTMKYLKILRFVLLPIVITPQCRFLKILVTLRIIKVILIGLIAPIHFSLPHLFPELHSFILLMLLFTWIDMYLMFHIAYYNEKGLLVYHPAKTASWYLKNNFLLDLITGFPISLVIDSVYPKKENKPSLIHHAPGLIMVLQYYKFYQAFNYLESDILRILQHIKLLKYIPLSIIIINVITGGLILLECNEAVNETFHTYGSNNLEFEYHKSLTIFCFPPNITAQQEESLYPLKFYFIVYYWVTSTTTQCGFGDISAHNRTTMIAVIFMVFLGLFLNGYIFATLTGSMISAYNFIAEYRADIREMLKFVKENGASAKIQKRLKLFYQFIWLRTEGAEPQKMLTFVHEALRLNVLANIYESTINMATPFRGAEKSVLAVISRCMEEVYFLRGETIVKYNDIQEYIYLVHRGRVDLFSKDSTYITSMETGGLFGNVSNKPMTRSTIVVVTSKNVDALRLKTSLFFQTLQMFPNTKKISEKLKTVEKEYIEPIMSETGYLDPMTPLIEDKETLPYEITIIKTVRPSITHFRGIDIMSLSKTYLYWHNSIYLPPWQKKSNFVILHDSWISIALQRIYTILATFTCTVTPYMLIFQIMDYRLWIVSYVIDILFLTRIWLEFHLSYFDREGNYIVDMKKIRKRFFRNTWLLGMDVFTNIPFELFALVGGPTMVLKVIPLLRLNRCLRFYYIYYYYDLRKKVLMINKIYLELFWIVVSLALMIHFFACGWIFITRPLGKKVPTSWISEMYLSKADNWELYLYAVYYIVGIITTTGYGDLKVVAGSEVLLSTFVMLAGRFGVAMLVGSLAAVINVHSQTLFSYQEKINELKEYFVQNKVSKYQISKMWRYLTSLWLKESGKQIPKFVANAPHVMRCEAMTSMFGDHLAQSFAFCDTNEAFLRQLSIYLQRCIYFPGNYIAHQGDIDHTMYFIHTGQIAVLTIHTNLMETVHFKLTSKDNFGMTQGLITGKPHHFTYRAETEAEILSLNLDDWKHLLKYFPDDEPKIYDRLKYLPFHKELVLDNIPTSF